MKCKHVHFPPKYCDGGHVSSKELGNQECEANPGDEG